MAWLLKTHPTIAVGIVSLLLAGWALAQPIPELPTTTTTHEHRN